MTQVGDIEIDQQTNAAATQFQVSEQLGLMERKELGDTLQFHYYEVFNEQVNSIAVVDFQITVDDGQRMFMLGPKSSELKFISHARLVRAFKQTRTERSVHLHGGTHDLTSDVVDFHS
jgi:hypothetical protein